MSHAPSGDAHEVMLTPVMARLPCASLPASERLSAIFSSSPWLSASEGCRRAERKVGDIRAALLRTALHVLTRGLKESDIGRQGAATDRKGAGITSGGTRNRPGGTVISPVHAGKVWRGVTHTCGDQPLGELLAIAAAPAELAL